MPRICLIPESHSQDILPIPTPAFRSTSTGKSPIENDTTEHPCYPCYPGRVNRSKTKLSITYFQVISRHRIGLSSMLSRSSICIGFLHSHKGMPLCRYQADIYIFVRDSLIPLPIRAADRCILSTLFIPLLLFRS